MAAVVKLFNISESSMAVSRTLSGFNAILHRAYKPGPDDSNASAKDEVASSKSSRERKPVLRHRGGFYSRDGISLTSPREQIMAVLRRTTILSRDELHEKVNPKVWTVKL